jgi:hypothetical protein
LIYIENNKFKTNKFILKNKILLKDLKYWNNYNFCLSSIKQDGNAIQFVKSKLQTKELCELAIKQNCSSLQYITPKLITEELFELVSDIQDSILCYIKPEYKQNKYVYLL